ncbi:Hypp559 [Branchiostoma lanceolatum]|uniref:Hypp559 protein n=1 Tax=Branchiostoma lanceolatum TaxID=7740 RepID=A0A8J9YLG6_BRALA|nr:Hypp559 [Branchiostoma lanceolatum]
MVSMWSMMMSRMLSPLKLAKHLKTLAGVIRGRLCCCKKKKKRVSKKGKASKQTKDSEGPPGEKKKRSKADRLRDAKKRAKKRLK